MVRVTIEEVPQTPRELEEYVAALFQASGYYVEKSVVERDHPEEVLELDVVATRYEDRFPVDRIIEAKSGNWGYPDLFKVAGWMKYLGIEEGGFFIREVPENKKLPKTASRADAIGIQLVLLDDFEAAERTFREAGFGEPIDALTVDLWRASFWIERKLLDVLQEAAGEDEHVEGPRAAKSYHHLVNSSIFFEDDVRSRLRELYRAYQAHPKLTLGAAEELRSGEFSPDTGSRGNELFRKAYLYGEYPVLQGCLYTEHRARLAILKCAIDYLCLDEAEALPEGDGLVNTDSLFRALLPDSVLGGMERMQDHENFQRYALFWQVFLWLFGGFYLTDREEEEFEWLSEHTGVPVREIPTALGVFDALFPMTAGSWLTSPGKTRCQLVKLVPVPFRGLGAYLRKRRYGVESYSDLGYSDFTGQDLARWHNCMVKLLAGEVE